MPTYIQASDPDCDPASVGCGGAFSEDGRCHRCGAVEARHVGVPRLRSAMPARCAYVADYVADLAKRASVVSRSARRPGPALTKDSSRERIIDWLVWADPDGCWTDEALAREYDAPPMSVLECWGQVAIVLSQE